MEGETKEELELTIPKNLTTWIFEDGTFIPMAKLQGENSYSIITDHLGTPTEAYDQEGEKVWSRQLNIYGETRKENGVKNFIPFLYQGQYFDTETELAYNRFRYYSPESGTYVSQDPVGLAGAMPNMYSYVIDLNAWIAPFGLYDNKPLTDGYVYRGIDPGGSNNYSPDANDLVGEGISTKPPKSHGDISPGDRRFLEKGGTRKVQEIDAAKLTQGGDLSVVKDGKAHASIKPSQSYLDKKGMTMAEDMDDWHKGGDSHELKRYKMQPVVINEMKPRVEILQEEHYKPLHQYLCNLLNVLDVEAERLLEQRNFIGNLVQRKLTFGNTNSSKIESTSRCIYYFLEYTFFENVEDDFGYRENDVSIGFAIDYFINDEIRIARHIESDHEEIAYPTMGTRASISPEDFQEIDKMKIDFLKALNIFIDIR